MAPVRQLVDDDLAHHQVAGESVRPFDENITTFTPFDSTRSTIARILKAQGLSPVPGRPCSSAWRES